MDIKGSVMDLRNHCVLAQLVQLFGQLGCWKCSLVYDAEILDNLVKPVLLTLDHKFSNAKYLLQVHVFGRLGI